MLKIKPHKLTDQCGHKYSVTTAAKLDTTFSSYKCIQQNIIYLKTI